MSVQKPSSRGAEGAVAHGKIYAAPPLRSGRKGALMRLAALRAIERLGIASSLPLLAMTRLGVASLPLLAMTRAGIASLPLLAMTRAGIASLPLLAMTRLRIASLPLLALTRAGIASLPLLAMTAYAQDAYPVKPIRFLVGQSPGGATDIVARMVAGKMNEPLGQNIVVENRTGAAGSIAAATAAKSAPDGYTLLVVSSSYAINPSLYASLPFDPQKDLAPISLFAEAPFLLVVHPSVPAKSVKDLIGIAKASPGTLTYGSGGNGSSGHLAGALFESLARVKLSHIPYKGAGVALVDVVSGQIGFMFASVLSSTPHVKQQRLRALAVTGAKRSPALPNVPTVAEAGLPGYATTTWYGLLGPAGLRPQVLDRLATAANKALHAPDLRERMLADGAEPHGSTPAVFQKHIAQEMAKWRQVVKAAGVKSE